MNEIDKEIALKIIEEDNNFIKKYVEANESQDDALYVDDIEIIEIF